VRRAMKALGAKGKRPDVLMYEIWTPLQRLDEIVDISHFLQKKLAAVRAYRSQCAVVGFVEAVRGLNRYRGEMHSWPGGDYAEVFARLTP
jgi:N-acetylglucosamine malate deacetylase 1